MVYGIDEQWTADLIEVNNIAKYNRGYFFYYYYYLLSFGLLLHIKKTNKKQNKMARGAAAA